VEPALSGRFDGKAVVITGASGDIGRVVARTFAAEGARLGLVARGNSDAIAGLGTIVTCDLLAPADQVRAGVEAARDTLMKALGRCDALILLAGLPATPALWNKSLDEVSAQDLHDAFAVDTVGTFLFAQAFAGALRKSHGSIVVTSSSAAFYGDVLGLAYAPAKSANAGLVKMLARVLAPEVRVNGIAPGGIDTGWLHSLSDADKAHASAQTLLRRLGRPEEIAQAILDLGAPGYANGQVLQLDGGVFPPPSA
jgi:NAD(P)-dependent dehydrogenase (short-subunit alcohol dehydrogenase family)